MATKSSFLILLSVLLLSPTSSLAYHASSIDQQGGDHDDQNPYLFPHESYAIPFRTHKGTIKVLERFNKRSELLNGIQNYGVAVVEIQPKTFILPNHWDADSICVVVEGHGYVTLIPDENKQETHELKAGDVILIRSGVTVHIVNKDDTQTFIMVALTVPVNTPGLQESFFAAGSKLMESYYNAFSDQILQAAFNIDEDQVKMMFQPHTRGPFVKATEKQIQELSSLKSGSWPFGVGRHSSKPHNLFIQPPVHSNHYGQLFEVNTYDYKQLRDLDVQVSYVNITRGGMIGPYFNTRATSIVFVVSGTGYFETMTVLPESIRRGHSITYDRLTGRVIPGEIYVIPAGHPVVSVATMDQNLELLCYEIGAQNNQRIPLVGRNNILRKMGNVAKVLSFNMDLEYIERLLSKQEESWFFPGPELQKQQEEDRFYHQYG